MATVTFHPDASHRSRPQAHARSRPACPPRKGTMTSVDTNEAEHPAVAVEDLAFFVEEPGSSCRPDRAERQRGGTETHLGDAGKRRRRSESAKRLLRDDTDDLVRNRVVAVGVGHVDPLEPVAPRME